MTNINLFSKNKHHKPFAGTQKAFWNYKNFNSYLKVFNNFRKYIKDKTNAKSKRKL